MSTLSLTEWVSVLPRRRWSVGTLEMFCKISLSVPSQQMTRFLGASWLRAPWDALYG